MNSNNRLQIVSPEQAIKLKELGFNWKAQKHYFNNPASPEPASRFDIGYKPTGYDVDWNDRETYGWPDAISGGYYYSAPTVALALKWIRDVRGFSIIPYWNGDEKFYWIMEEIKCCLDGQVKKNSKNSIDEEPHSWKSYEECEFAGLDYALNYFIERAKGENG